MFRAIIIWPLLILLMSCGSEEINSEGSLETKKVLLKPTYTYSYNSTAGIHPSDYSDPESTLIDISNGRIVEFDPKTYEQLFSYEIPTEGKYKIKGVSDFDAVVKHQGYYYYFSHFGGEISKIDPKSGEITIAHTVGKNETGILVGSFATPPLLIDGTIYVTLMSNPVEVKHKRGAILAYDINSGTTEEVFNFPKEYDEDFYGTISYIYWATVAYCPWRNSFLVSYPVSDEVFEFDRNYKLVGKHHAVSDYISKIKPFVQGAIDVDIKPNWKEDRAYYDQLSHYDGIFVDAKRKKGVTAICPTSFSL